jgi:hypothetical protein
MIRALYTAASGMNAQQANIDNVAHNIANVNTSGFKKTHMQFEDLVYQEARVPGSPTSVAGESPVGLPPASARGRWPRRATSARATCARPTRRSISPSRATASSR